MKKTISLILAVVMLLSVVPMQSFALFENLQNPRIADAEFIDERPVSAQDVYNAAGDSNNNDFQYIGYGWKYEYMVYLSDGTEIKVVDDYGSNNEKDKFEVIKGNANNIAQCSVDATVIPAKCASALKSGKDTVTVGLQVDIEFANGGTRYTVIRKDHKLIEKYINDIKLISDLDGEISDLYHEGHLFEVEYYDGRKEVYTLEIVEVIDPEMGYVWPEPYLNDFIVSFYSPVINYYIADNGEKVYFEGCVIEYFDARSLYIKEVLECKYAEVKITAYNIDAKGQLQDISYKIIYADGRIFEDKYVVDGDGINIDETFYKNDDRVCIEYFIDEDEKFNLSVSAGEDFWGIKDTISGHASENCDCICHKDGLNRIIYIFKCIWWIITLTNMTCQCGAEHW